jgi:hypothetical protein
VSVPVEVEGDDPQSIEASCAGKSDEGHNGRELGPSKIVNETKQMSQARLSC